jgi:guanosine-3',5'-bis(diphosphate) 3'-pyrophosphohydrolase
MRTQGMTLRLEEAMRFAAKAHDGQVRKGSGTLYFEHVAAVALILDRVGFPEDVVVAGLLHDVVEDTATCFEDVAARFGARVSELVRHCSEVKMDGQGNKRPWIDRKRDHLAALAEASPEAWAIILADKLHNLISIELDLRENRSVWSQFHAEREQVLWYYRSAIERCGRGDVRLESLAGSCWDVLARVEFLQDQGAC